MPVESIWHYRISTIARARGPPFGSLSADRTLNSSVRTEEAPSAAAEDDAEAQVVGTIFIIIHSTQVYATHETRRDETQEERARGQRVALGLHAPLLTNRRI